MKKKLKSFPCTCLQVCIMSTHPRNEAAFDGVSRLKLAKEPCVFYTSAYSVTLQLNSKWINVCICLCVHVCVEGPQGPVLMSYLCAFLTRARCSAHGTVILGRGWPCAAARLCRLLYLWHHRHLAVCLCASVHSPVCAFQEGGSAGGLTQEANTVYISIMNQVAERERERREKQRGREREGGWMEKAIFPLLFSTLPATNPCGVYSLYSPYSLFSTLFSIFFPYFFFFPFSWIDQIASPSFSTALKAIFQALGVWLDRAHRSLFHSPSVSTLDIRHQPGQWESEFWALTAYSKIYAGSMHQFMLSYCASMHAAMWVWH